MEQDTTAKIAEQKRQREIKAKKKRTIGWIAVAVVVIVLGVGGWLVYRSLSAREMEASMTSYQATVIQEGEIASTISGSGTLSANHSASYTAPGDYTRVESVNFNTGDAFVAGDVIMTLSCLEIEEDITALQAELDDVLDDLATVSQEKSSLKVTAPKAGVVKNLQASVGTNVDDVDYLCLLSTDGKMKLVIEKTDAFSAFDKVVVDIGGVEVAGLVTQVDQDNMATVIVDDNSFDYGASCTVYDQRGSQLGVGTLDVNEYVYVTATAGRVDQVNCTENQRYARGRALFVLESGAQSDTYLEYKQQREDLEEQIQNLKDGLIITAEWDGMLVSLSVEKGDRLDTGAALCTLSSTDGYQLSMAIDELDIGSIKLDQVATVTLDAVDGSFTGSVKNISYDGSGTYVTSYTVTIVTEPIAGAYPGMSASAEVVIESSGTSMIVPVGALQYQGRGENQTAYVYLAGDTVAAGDTQTAQQLDLENLEKVTVTTGMSDGSYIVIQSDQLSVGDLIWQSTLTTNAVYSSNDSANTTTSFMGGNMPGSMGGYNGGSMRGGAGSRNPG